MLGSQVGAATACRDVLSRYLVARARPTLRYARASQKGMVESGAKPAGETKAIDQLLRRQL